ncbi:hypothetical protein JPH1_07760 [Mycobacterium avium subsp. hominissuis]|uniref:Uncharacterized protein n=1 Tax=Mycobacterium avium subsp. hominissuis TaxID=439334 RepID=A0AAI8SJV4_MYCAV|nr:hypothetical protein JPH1_07760 [Mycobacterium avium subsp. hominissuis]
MQVALSTYYDAKARVPSARALRDAVLGPALCQLWKDNYCVYGGPQTLENGSSRWS